MHEQRRRDAVTIVIATSVLIFAVLVTSGALGLFLARAQLGVGPSWDDVGTPLMAVAACIALAYLYRHRRP